jgi:hypothetical protein
LEQCREQPNPLLTGRDGSVIAKQSAASWIEDEGAKSRAHDAA